jgi:hypothetical protein
VRSNRDDGSVLIADLVLASAIVLVVAAIASAFGGVAGAMQDDREAARHAAVIAARTGDLDRATSVARRLAPGATVRIDATRDHVTAWVGGPIVVAHPIRRSVTITAQGEAQVPIAPYRSNRG